VRDELADRYGPLPPPVENLLSVATFRAHARRAGLTDVTLQGSLVRFGPVDLPESGVAAHAAALPEDALQAGGPYHVGAPPDDGQGGGRPVLDVALLAWCRAVVDALLDRPTVRVKENP
jgi:transcription-repair coupling factor (superfamily II helicase)